MKRLTESLQVADLGTIMGIWAHPDDESFMVAGVMAVAARNGQKVICITATKGEASTQGARKWSSSTLGDVRAHELAEALEILGVQHHHWLNYADGACRDVPADEVVKRLVNLMENYQPDTVITFPPDGVTGHLDHIAVSRWATAAVKQISTKKPKLLYAVITQESFETCIDPIDECLNLFYNVDEPCLLPGADCEVVLRLDPEIAKLKYQALAAMPSQYDKLVATFDRGYLESHLTIEALVSAERERQWGSPVQS